jgi:hypothetical protein
MSDSKDLQQRAAKFLALAIHAREAGYEQYADQFVARAMDCLNQARSADAPTEPGPAETSLPVQQEPTPQADKKGD